MFSLKKKPVICKLVTLIISQVFLFNGLAVSYAAGIFDEKPVLESTLSPRVNLEPALIQMIFNSLPEQQVNVPFIMEGELKDAALKKQLGFLNSAFLEKGKLATVKIIFENEQLYNNVARVIRAQDRMEDTPGITINHEWAMAFKEEALRRAIEKLKGKNIIFSQMEYELSQEFLGHFRNLLQHKYNLSEVEARYASGQLAKLQMAGGLGSFKPDLVRGFYDVMKKFLGEIQARDSIHVLGVLYAKAIKGDKKLIEDTRLNAARKNIREKEKKDIIRDFAKIVRRYQQKAQLHDNGKVLKAVNELKNVIDSDNITAVIEVVREMTANHNNEETGQDEENPLRASFLSVLKKVLEKHGKEDREVHDLIGVARQAMDLVTIFRDIKIGMADIDTVDVYLYRDPFSELHEYWIYCPQIFHEAYPGQTNDHFRSIQAYLYREVQFRLLKRLNERGHIGDDVIISDSETSTAFANPTVVSDDLTQYKGYTSKELEQYEEIFQLLEDMNIFRHHYNHTIVPAGMNRPPVTQLKKLKIQKELEFIQSGEQLDARRLVGETHDIITGCSTAHTQICKEDPDIYKEFADKVKEDELFGNSEGSYIGRWQGDGIKEVVSVWMKRLKVNNYSDFFVKLNKEATRKNNFISMIKAVKRKQKQRFIEELFKGTFGELDMTREELEKSGVNLIDRPFFTFIRRMVPYKCSNLLVDMLYNADYRERIIKTGAVIFVGGRKFDDFADDQHRRIKELIEHDPRLKAHIIFISNHNVDSSWMIQQGTDFGGMLSWEGMEAGPTSPSNAGLNWTNLFSSPDGVMLERVHKIKRDIQGKIVAGTGYCIQYGNEIASDGKSRLPSKDSIMENMEKGAIAYYNQEDYDTVAFNNMWLNMTQGDICTQASGLLLLFAKSITGREQQEQK
ncbi:MAG: glycogen/starch/alpha-glucan phosphorylase [Candidatus Omnitrophica bacterium]|nr:glycogen/starch/alpha-glucan phosphorylase [Candidatus Omnitrophota bacterium]